MARATRDLIQRWRLEPRCGIPCAMHGELVDLLRGAGGSQGFATAADLLQRASAEGDGEATAVIATMEAVGAGRVQNWNNALDLLQLSAEQGWARAQDQLRLLARCDATDDWKTLRESIDIDALVAPPERSSLCDEPRIRSARGFASAQECAWLIRAAEKDLRPAEIWDGAQGIELAHQSRTNSLKMFDLLDVDVVIQVIRARIAAITMLPVPLFEPMQVLHYSIGQSYEPHHDYLDPALPGNAEQIDGFGQRIATFLLYLNEDFSGGETDFPQAKVSFRGRTGDAVFFANVDRSGKPDPRTLHTGKPPTAGEKWILSQWIRDRSPVVE